MDESENLVWPAEWEDHQATWIAWPHNLETWPHNLTAAQDEMEQLIRLISERETVRLLVAQKHHSQVVARSLDQLKGVEIWPIETDDAWVRDYGPTVVLDGSPQGMHLVDWTYNAWGNKYPPFDQDQMVTKRCAEVMGCEVVSTPYVMEGGAIEGNGRGLLLTTASCLFHPGRNPNSKRKNIEALFQKQLATQNVVWLPGGEIAGDDTDGHIDQIARFVDEDRIIVMNESDTSDVNRSSLDLNRIALLDELQRLDLPKTVIDMPMPGVVEYLGVRLPASYANFIWVNGGIVVPQFADANDARALGMYRDLLPNRDVIGLSCRELVVGLGAWHCLTQQHCVGG